MTVSRSISFEAPAQLLNLNDRMHWAKKARLTKAWRERVYWSSYEHGWGAIQANELPPCTIDVSLPVSANRRRDPMNLVATTKACVDGLVDAAWWPDDSAEYITVLEPTLVVGGNVVTITARERT